MLSLITLSRCEGSHSSSLQERLFQLSIPAPHQTKRWCRRRPLLCQQWPAFVAGPAVLLFARGLALNSRNFACRLLETLGHRYILQTRYLLWLRAPDHRFLARTHSRRALGVWRRGQKWSNSGTSRRCSWDFVRDRLVYHHQLVSTAPATHPENTIQPNLEVPHNTSEERGTHGTFAFRN